MGFCGERLAPRRGRKHNMPRRLPEKTKNAPRKPRRFGSQSRFRPSTSFLQLRPVKENEEIQVVIDDIGSRGDGVARIQGYSYSFPAATWENEPESEFEA